jgi:hypothetical protein
MFESEVSVDVQRTLEFFPNQETWGADNMSMISSGELEVQESTIQDIPARGVLVLAKESKIQTTEPASIIFEDTCIVQYTHAEPTEVLLMNRIELDHKAIALEGSDDSDSLVEEQFVPNSIEWIQQTVENLTKKDKMQKLTVMMYPGIVKVAAKDTKSLLIIESGAILKNVIACSVKFVKSCSIVDDGAALSAAGGTSRALVKNTMIEFKENCLVELQSDAAYEFQEKTVVIEVYKNKTIDWSEQTIFNQTRDYKPGETLIFFKNCQNLEFQKFSREYYYLDTQIQIEPLGAEVKVRHYQTRTHTANQRISFTQLTKLTFLSPTSIKYTTPCTVTNLT